MPNVLSSWKEIGNYLGRGVRTVQRWEQEFGLPIRRPAGPARHSVIAMPDELDAWTRSRAHGPGGPVMAAIRNELAMLRAETADLRRRMEMCESARAKASASVESDLPRATARKGSSGSNRMRAQTPGTIREVRDDVGRVKALVAQTRRAESLRQRLSAAWKMWWAAENDRRRDRNEAAEQTLCDVQAMADKVRRSLDKPGYVPETELKGLRDEIGTLQQQIDGTRSMEAPRRERRIREMDRAAV